MSVLSATGGGFLTEVEKFIGTPYVWGGAAPGGFDCSGLVQYGLEQLGLKNVPRTSEDQWGWVQKIKQSQLQPGDLIFETWPGEASPGHVVIYAGNGQIVQAPATGQDVQKVKWSPQIVQGEGGKVVGYGRVPGLSYNGEPAGGGGGGGGLTGAQQAQLTSFLGAGSGGVLADAGGLLHGTAVVIDRLFGMFAPGNGWRLIFGAGALVLFLLSFKAFAGGGLVGG